MTIKARLVSVESDGGIWVMLEDGTYVEGYHTVSDVYGGADIFGAWPPEKFRYFKQRAHAIDGAECLVEIYDNGVKRLIEKLTFC